MRRPRLAGAAAVAAVLLCCGVLAGAGAAAEEQLTPTNTCRLTISGVPSSSSSSGSKGPIATASISCTGGPAALVTVGVQRGGPLSLASHSGVTLDPHGLCGYQAGQCLMSICNYASRGTILFTAPTISGVALLRPWVAGAQPYAILCLNGSMRLDAANVSGNTVSIDDTSDSTYTVGGAVKVEADSRVAFTRSVFAANTNTGNGLGAGGAMYIAERASVVLQDCELRDNRLARTDDLWGGGAVYAWQARLTAMDSRFVNNTVDDAGGGAIEADNSVVSLQRCLFKNNQVGLLLPRGARSSKSYPQGGAVYFWVDSNDASATSNSYLVIDACSFINNTSHREAGALSLYAPRAAIRNSTFAGNRATIMGGAIDALSNQPGAPNRLELHGCVFSNNNSPTGGAVSLRSGAYGGSLDVDITRSRFDRNRATSSNGGAISFEANGTLTLNASTFNNNTSNLPGADVAARVGAQVLFPGSTTGATALRPNSPTVFWPRTSCELGEVRPASGGICTACPAATFSLDPSNPECLPCPRNAACAGGADIAPSPGFWHSGELSPQIHRCPMFTAACDNADPSTRCRPGYDGPLCGCCSPGFGSTAPFRCGRCLPRPVLLLLYVLAALGSFALVAATSHLTWQDNHDPSTTGVLRPSDVLKVLLLFLQWLLIVAAMVPWPSSMLRLLGVVGGVFASANGQAVSLDCLFPDERGLPSQAVTRQLASLLMPLALLVALLALHSGWFGVARAGLCGARRAQRLRPGDLGTKLLVAALVTVFFCFPSLVSSALTWFACVPIDSPDGLFPRYASLTAPHGWWVLHVRQACYEGWHRTWALGLGVPCVLLFCIAVPGCMCVLLRVHRASVGQPWFRARFGFLTRIYRPHAPYYEAVTALQTVLLSTVSVFRYALGSVYALLLVGVLLVLSASLQWLVRPHAFRTLHVLQLGATACLYFAACAGLALAMADEGVRGSSGLHAEALAGCVIAAVAAFVACAAWHLLHTSRRALQAACASAAALCERGAAGRAARGRAGAGQGTPAGAAAAAPVLQGTRLRGGTFGSAASRKDAECPEDCASVSE